MAALVLIWFEVERGSSLSAGRESNKFETWKKLDVLKTVEMGRIYFKMLEEMANVVGGSLYGEYIFK